MLTALCRAELRRGGGIMSAIHLLLLFRSVWQLTPPVLPSEERAVATALGFCSGECQCRCWPLCPLPVSGTLVSHFVSLFCTSSSKYKGGVTWKGKVVRKRRLWMVIRVAAIIVMCLRQRGVGRILPLSQPSWVCYWSVDNLHEKSNAVLVFVILLRASICFVLICLLGKRINTFLFYKTKVSYSAFFFSSSVSSQIADLSCVVILRLKNA